MFLKLTRTCLLLCAVKAFILIPDSLSAQPGTPLFQVIHLPRKASYSKDKLNAELVPLRDKQAVKKLLRSKNFPANTSLVIYINRPDNQAAYWTINTSSPADREDNRIILQSRDNATTKIFKLAEFKNVLKDTLAVIDTLSLELYIRDEDYPDDQYTLSTLCSKNKKENKIPLSNEKLILTKELLSDCKESITPVSMYNNSNPVRILASFRLKFLSADEKEVILSMANFIRNSEPAKDLKEVAWQLYVYGINHFGRFYFPQLLNWLEKNNAAISHGNH